MKKKTGIAKEKTKGRSIETRRNREEAERRKKQ
jgi:hypothetical protein